MKILCKKFKKGFSLVEVLIAIIILTLSIGALLLTYANCFILIDLVRNVNSATNAAQEIMEELRSMPFTQLMGPCDCNTVLCDGCTFNVNNIPGSIGSIDIDDTNSELLVATVSVCWRQRGRVIGEDINLNGTLDVGEDANGNGIIDSPVELITRIANR